MSDLFSMWLLGQSLERDKEKYDKSGPYERRKIIWKWIIMTAIAIPLAIILIKAES